LRALPSQCDEERRPAAVHRFGFAAIGVPRNSSIPANADPQYYDLGLCGPLRMDLKERHEYCGLFRTPSLRNVAMRPVFFITAGCIP